MVAYRLEAWSPDTTVSRGSHEPGRAYTRERKALQLGGRDTQGIVECCHAAVRPRGGLSLSPTIQKTIMTRKFKTCK